MFLKLIASKGNGANLLKAGIKRSPARPTGHPTKQQAFDLLYARWFEPLAFVLAFPTALRRTYAWTRLSWLAVARCWTASSDSLI